MQSHFSPVEKNRLLHWHSPSRGLPGAASLTLQSPHVVGCQMADEGLLGAGWDVWPQDAGRGANCHVVPGIITRPLRKAQGLWTLQLQQSQALELLASAGLGIRDRNIFDLLPFLSPGDNRIPFILLQLCQGSRLLHTIAGMLQNETTMDVHSQAARLLPARLGHTSGKKPFPSETTAKGARAYCPPRQWQQ